MPRFISIAKAASLANVPAKEVQQRIDSKQLTTTRGQIHIDDLIDCFPGVLIEEADMLSFVTKIKEESFEAGARKQHGEISLKSLKDENLKLKINLEYYRERSEKFEELVLYLQEYLEGLQEKLGESQRIKGLIKWIEKRISEIRRND